MCISHWQKGSGPNVEYERDYLLEFESHPSSSRRPSNLPQISTLIKNSPICTPVTNHGGSHDIIKKSKTRKRPNRRQSSASFAFKDIYKGTGEFLGQGSCGKVETFVNIHTGRRCAVKTIEKTPGVYSRSDVMKEIEVNYLCEGHPNIVQLLEYFEEDDKFYLVFEKISGGPLQQHIQKRKQLTEVEASSIIGDLAESLLILHNQGIAHRDVKPSNVLCINPDSSYPVKLCDFDLCSQVHSGSRTPRLHSPVGSCDFMAPEVVNAFMMDYPQFYYDKKCDLWSLGILMYILLCGYPPFTGHCDGKCGWDLGEACKNCEAQLFSSIRDGRFSFPDMDWSSVSMEAKHLIESLLEKDVQSRLDAEDVLCHPWIVKGGCSKPSDTPKNIKRKKSFRNVLEFARTSTNLFSRSSFDLSPPNFFNMELDRNG